LQNTKKTTASRFIKTPKATAKQRKNPDTKQRPRHKSRNPTENHPDKQRPNKPVTMADELAESTHSKELDRLKIDSILQQYPDVPRQVAKVPRRERLRGSLTAAQDNYQARSPMGWLETFIPMVQWLRAYDFKANIVADIIAGVTVTTVIIPQSMSFAKLAGLPVQFGLYCGFVPIYAYSVFGTSRQLAIGTSAVSSLTFNSVMTALVNPSGE